MITLNSENLPTHQKLNLSYSYRFFEDLRVIADSWHYKVNPRTQPLKYCMKYDVMDYIRSLFPEIKDASFPYNDRTYSFGKDEKEEFNFSDNGLYIHKADYSDLKKLFAKSFPPFITEYFIDEFCFLIAYYHWLLPKEIKHDYLKNILGFFPIQPYEDENLKTEMKDLGADMKGDESCHKDLIEYLNLDADSIKEMSFTKLAYAFDSAIINKEKILPTSLEKYATTVDYIHRYKERREPLYRLIHKLINDKSTNPIFRRYLFKWDYYQEIRKRTLVIHDIKRELKTTNKEIPNLMLVKKRAFNSFYCYLKYTALPNIDSYWKKGGFVNKYALSKQLDELVAAREIINMKLYVDSESKLLQMTGYLMQLAGLIDKENLDILDYLKKYQKGLAKRANKGSQITEQDREGIKETNKHFNIKRMVGSLKRQVNWWDERKILTKAEYKEYNLNKQSQKK